MDALTSYLITEIAKAAGEGNMVKGGAWFIFFVVIWLEVRGMKKEIKNLNTTVAAGFQAGEDRFEKIERQQLAFEHRLTMLEPTNKL
jgi:hypothetical protein